MKQLLTTLFGGRKKPAPLTIEERLERARVRYYQEYSDAIITRTRQHSAGIRMLPATSSPLYPANIKQAKADLKDALDEATNIIGMESLTNAAIDNISKIK